MKITEGRFGDGSVEQESTRPKIAPVRKLWKTEKEKLTPTDILEYIATYERDYVPWYDMLWRYYEGKDSAILGRKNVSPNNPDNRVPVPYGRKIVTTFSGYAFRPKYITYKAAIERDMSEDGERGIMPEEQYAEAMDTTFQLNDEHIKTSRAGRNFAIFGVSYELLYIDGIPTGNPKLPMSAETRFFNVDPREMILLYDFASEAKKKMAIRFYAVSANKYKVEVYYKDRIERYDRMRTSTDNSAWILTPDLDMPVYANHFDDIPVVAYYFGDDMLGVIEPVLPLIDANDVLFSDAMNEFDRFSFAYLVIKGYSLTDPTKKDPSQTQNALAMLKKSRIFEGLTTDADISFLTKDIPTGFIQFMSDSLREQIHVQSHVPDFTSDKMAGASGIAIQKLMFDFENVVASVEADFDCGLLDRIRLITTIYRKTGKPDGEPSSITISHKRNMPDNLRELADTALVMKNAGFSDYLVADVMPDDVIPDVQVELLRQKKEQESMLPDLDAYTEEQPDAGLLEGSDPAAQALNGAQIESMVSVVKSVSANELAPESAILILKVAFPTIADSVLIQMVNQAAGIELASPMAPAGPVPAALAKANEETEEPEETPEEGQEEENGE